MFNDTNIIETKRPHHPDLSVAVFSFVSPGGGEVSNFLLGDFAALESFMNVQKQNRKLKMNKPRANFIKTE
jgi:hypothetical protein